MAQVFDLLAEVIEKLEAPARSEETRARYQRIFSPDLVADPASTGEPGPSPDKAAAMTPEARVLVQCAAFVFDRIHQLQARRDLAPHLEVEVVHALPEPLFADRRAT